MKNLTFLIWCLLICVALSFKDNKPKELLSKPYPDTRQEVRVQGKILEKPIQSVEMKEHKNHYGCSGLSCPLL